MLHSIMKEKILIAGGGCISEDLQTKLKNKYDVVVTSRSSGDFKGDLRDQSFVKQLVSQTGNVAGVICCVGGPGTNDKIDNLNIDFFSTIENNLYGPINLTRFYLPEMKKLGRGCFIYMSSNLTSCIRTPKNYFGYTLAKSSLEKMTDILSTNEADTGVRFNCLILGFVRTEKYKDKMNNQELVKKSGKVGGCVEVGQVHDIVEYILENKTITGLKARVDNGNHHN